MRYGLRRLKFSLYVGQAAARELCRGSSANYSARESLQQREGSGANEVGPHAQYPALFPLGEEGIFSLALSFR